MGIHVQYSVLICKSEILFVAHIQGCYNFLGLSCLALFECSYTGHFTVLYKQNQRCNSQ